jgi:hypothetical protein
MALKRIGEGTESEKQQRSTRFSFRHLDSRLLKLRAVEQEVTEHEQPATECVIFKILDQPFVKRLNNFEYFLNKSRIILRFPNNPKISPTFLGYLG